jgi:phosphoribosylformimino-5-aminoimidazole carboxamide ribonucleotide (ProFAR) isomerase
VSDLSKTVTLKITYRDDPIKQVKEFSSAVAELVHIVDLNGSKRKCVTADTISTIAAFEQLKIEAGGDCVMKLP